MHTAFLSFNSGTVSPYLRHRVDLDKAASSCETLHNFIPLPYGAAVKRPGLQSIRTVQIDSEPVLAGENQRLIPFTASTGDQYLLHFMPDVLKIYGLDGTLKDTKTFMDGYVWPDDPWLNGIRALHVAPINDVAFITHPGTFPLRLSRVNDTEWHLAFIPFQKAPMLDENTDKNKTFTVASDPVAPDWTNGETYAVDDVVFTNCEWKCTADHTATAGKKPGSGADWRDYWQRMFYVEGDPVTLLADDREQDAWETLWEYTVGDWVFVGESVSGLYADDTFDATIGYIYQCTEDHEMPATDEEDADIVGTGYWDAFEEWGSSYNNLGDKKFHRGSTSIYECIQAHMASFHEPSVAGDWTDYWTLVGPYSAPAQWRPRQYQDGTVVSRKGRVYECILDHRVEAKNRPGSGSDWETYWTETSRMVEEFSMGEFSPGQYFRISPERDEQDFQTELHATGTVDAVTRSEAIAVQGNWNFNTFGTWWGTFQLQRSANNGKSWSVIRSWQASGDRNIADAGTEDTPVLLRLKFTKEDGGTTEAALDQDDQPPRGILAPESPYITGYCLMDTYNSADEMTGTAKTAMLSGNTYRWAEGAFNSRDGFPRAIALHESRLVFASTGTHPVSLWFSATEDFTNFETGVEADDAIFATLAISNASPIVWLASQRRLFVGTTLGEWVAGSETSDAPLTPTNFICRQYSGFGSHPLQPLIAGDATFFLERRGNRLRELAYAIESQSYGSADLTRLAEHLFRDGIASIAWQQTREPCLWAVTREGGLLHFAYNKPERVTAWSSHSTEEGTFRDVAVLPTNDGDDHVFFIVDREDASHVERLPQHWLAAIETETATVLTDTDDELPITATIITLPIDVSSQDGVTLGRVKRAHKCRLSLVSSAGGTVWNRNEAAAQIIAAADADLFTGWKEVVLDPGHITDLQLRLTHNAAAPFILRTAVVSFDLHER